jgi:hypothetical protein
MMTASVVGYWSVNRVRVGLTLAALVTTTVGVAGQTPTKAPAQAPTYRGGVDLVTIRAVVRDGKGRAVMTLAKSDFELLDNGTPRDIMAVEQAISSSAASATGKTRRRSSRSTRACTSFSRSQPSWIGCVARSPSSAAGA